MKIIYSIVVVLLSVGVTLGQESRMPDAVEEAFRSSFAGATNIDWERERDMYEIEFEMDRAEHKILFDESGNIVEHKAEIASSDLPAEVMNTINTQYKEKQIDEIEKIEKDGRVVYQVEFERFMFDDKVIIGSDGKIEDS